MNYHLMFRINFAQNQTNHSGNFIKFFDFLEFHELNK